MIYNSSIEYPHISPLRWVEPLSDVRYLRKMGFIGYVEGSASFR